MRTQEEILWILGAPDPEMEAIEALLLVHCSVDTPKQ